MSVSHRTAHRPIATPSGRMGAQQEPTLRFVEEPYEPAHVEQLEAEFRDRGFVLLPDVFERVSVAPFRAAVQKKLRKLDPRPNRGTWDLPSDAAERVLPALAPRLRRFLPRLLSPPMPPQHGGVPATAQIFEMGWDACAGAEPSPAGGWHFDRGGQGSAGDGHYIYPEAVHAAMYCALPSAPTTPSAPHRYLCAARPRYRAGRCVRLHGLPPGVPSAAAPHPAEGERASGRRVHPTGTGCVVSATVCPSRLWSRRTPTRCCQQRVGPERVAPQRGVCAAGTGRHAGALHLRLPPDADVVRKGWRLRRNPVHTHADASVACAAVGAGIRSRRGRCCHVPGRAVDAGLGVADGGGDEEERPEGAGDARRGCWTAAVMHFVLMATRRQLFASADAAVSSASSGPDPASA